MAGTWTQSMGQACDLCGDGTPAVADANLGRGWANVCLEHFALRGVGLGVGLGQALVVDPAADAKLLELLEEGKPMIELERALELLGGSR